MKEFKNFEINLEQSNQTNGGDGIGNFQLPNFTPFANANNWQGGNFTPLANLNNFPQLQVFLGEGGVVYQPSNLSYDYMTYQMP